MKRALTLCAFAALSACTIVNTEPEVTRTSFQGYYNVINGKLSDGSTFEGVAWFKSGRRGDFCIQNKKTVCSGTFSTNADLRIKGAMTCSDGSTGTYTTDRIQDGDFVKPLFATGEMSDGRTAIAEFSPIKQGAGETLCYR